MIPTQKNIAKLQAKKRAQKHVTARRPGVHSKIADNFIESAITHSNISALKTIYYLSTILTEGDLEHKQDQDIIKLTIDKRQTLQYTEMTAPTLIRTARQMQETSITFVDEDEVIEGMALVPRYRFVPNRNTIEIDLYVRIARMIVAVKKQYTHMNIKELMHLKKAHSIRMLALLNLIAKDVDGSEKTRYMTLEELQAFFGVHYANWNEVERKIIRPVKDELDTHASRSFVYEAEYEALGKGRPGFKRVQIVVIDR